MLNNIWMKYLVHKIGESISRNIRKDSLDLGNLVL